MVRKMKMFFLFKYLFFSNGFLSFFAPFISNMNLAAKMEGNVFFLDFYCGSAFNLINIPKNYPPVLFELREKIVFFCFIVLSIF